MTLVIAAVVAGAVVATAYVALALESFRRVRRELASSAAHDASASSSAPGADELGPGSVAWRAGAGVIASTCLIVAISHAASAWYILPYLAIGSSLAVITAFMLDRR